MYEIIYINKSISIFNFRKVEFSVFKYGHVLCLLSINIIFPFLRIYIYVFILVLYICTCSCIFRNFIRIYLATKQELLQIDIYKYIWKWKQRLKDLLGLDLKIQIKMKSFTLMMLLTVFFIGLSSKCRVLFVNEMERF